MSFSQSVHQALAQLPTSSLLDQDGVVDVLLDLANAATDPADKERVHAVLRSLPRAAVLDRTAVCDLFLDLLTPEVAAV